MAKRTRYLGISARGAIKTAAWAAVAKNHYVDNCGYIFIANDNGVEVASYNFQSDMLQEEMALLSFEEPPTRILVHPGGREIICSFSNGCKLLEVEQVTPKLSEQRLSLLIGKDHAVFSVDGSRIATGGKSGHLRIFDWPSLKIILDEPNAHKSIKDLDFSLDGAFLASTSEDGPCRIWDLSKGSSLTSLHRAKDERFGFCRFSRNGAYPFLFITVNKDGKGLVAVWEIANWSRLGEKEYQKGEITSFAITGDGKQLAIGSSSGDISIIEVKKMELKLQVKNAHMTNVTALEFSPNSRGVLSISSDSSLRVTATGREAEWKDWQVYLVLLGLVFMSAVLFYVFFEFSDNFWNFPLGRNQPARPPLKAILGDDDLIGWQ